MPRISSARVRGWRAVGVNVQCGSGNAWRAGIASALLHTPAAVPNFFALHPGGVLCLEGPLHREALFLAPLLRHPTPRPGSLSRRAPP